jgi:hypothetical protein
MLSLTVARMLAAGEGSSSSRPNEHRPKLSMKNNRSQGFPTRCGVGCSNSGSCGRCHLGHSGRRPVVLEAGEEECGMSPDATALAREGSGSAWRVRSLISIMALRGGRVGPAGISGWVHTWWVRKKFRYWQKRSPDCDILVLHRPSTLSTSKNV